MAREIKRIPIVLDFFINNPDKLLEFTNGEEIENSKEVLKSLRQFWLYNSDQRFGQLLINKGYLSQTNFCWFNEDDQWLRIKGYLNDK